MPATAHPSSLRLRMLRRARPEVAHVADWLEAEREYAESKWPPGHVDDSISPARYQ